MSGSPPRASETSGNLSPYQLDIWLAESMASGSPQFNIAMFERFTGAVDVALLRDCFTRVLARHDAFRLRFDDLDGVPRRWIADEPPTVELVDLTGTPDPAAAGRAWRERAMSTPFAIRGTSLVQAVLLLEGDATVYMFLKVHHLLTDGRAGDMVRVELIEEYARHARGESADRPPAPSALMTGRGDYPGSVEHDQDLAFHRDRMARLEPNFFARRPIAVSHGGPAAFDPGESTEIDSGGPATVDSGRPAAGFGHHRFTLDGDLVERVKTSGSTPFAFLVAALGTWLARVHRADHAVVGVPLLNRRTTTELTTVAHYANTLPLRVDAPQGSSLDEIAADVGASVGLLQRHERLPLSDILRELPAGGDRRLFDVTVTLMRPQPASQTPGVERDDLTFFGLPHEGEALAVMLLSAPGNPDLEVNLFYATDVFDADLPIASLAEHLVALITHGLDKPQLPARELVMLGDRERYELARWSTGPRVPFAGATLHHLIARQAANNPQRPAILTADGRTLDYAALDAASNQVAWALRDRGVRPDDRVAVLMERGPNMLTAILGVLKAGGAYVPVDPGYPLPRKEFLLADCGAAVVVTDTGADVPAIPEVEVCSMDELLRGPTGPVEPSAGVRDLAYVIYTSGSTGRPKGVMVEHRSVVNRLAWMQRAFPIDSNDVLLQKTPISFDVSVWELFWWAIEGAAVALLPPGAEKDPARVVRAVADRGVTVLHFVPSMLGPFLDVLEESPQGREDVRSLRYVFCSGEALLPAHVEQFNRVFGDGPRLVNLYGPTEATVDVSAYECPTDAVTRVPIGRPIDNIELHVVDLDGNPQPAGVPGELWIGGVGVARGYLDRPELNRERFVDRPDRWYRTGDLARWLADGTLEYLGRIDGQVKIRGNRVELGEIENVLSRMPGVRGVAVVDRSVPGRGVALAAYYVGGVDVDAGTLRAQLAATLPEYMVPAWFVPVDAIPLTPNGKLDRRALPEPGGTSEDAVEPRNTTEATLAEIWAEVLGVPQVGVHDDYYALGGDSILMLRIRAAARRRGVHFSLNDLVKQRTVAALAAVAGAPAEQSDLVPFELITADDRLRLDGAVDAFPMTLLQIGLVYHSGRDENSAMYHDVFRYRLAMAWAEKPFRAAFDRLVARHPALRSSFDLSGLSEPTQVVHATMTGGLDVVDLRGRPDAEDEIAGHIEQRRRHHYRFDRPPLYLFRAHVRESGVDLVFSFHHALLDGGSVANLLRELLQDYLHSTGADIGPVPDTALPTPALHPRNEREALARTAAREHWQHVLAGAEPLRLDGFAPNEPPRGDDLVVWRVALPADLADNVRDLARRHALPVKSVLLAAHCLALRLFSGRDDATTGLITHGRPEREGADRMVGLFLNTVPVRSRAAGTWLDVARELFAQERDLLPHQHYPLNAIQQDHGTPVLHTAFNYVHFHVLADVLRLPDVALVSFDTVEETEFQLLVNAFTDPVDGMMGLRIDCDGRDFTPAQAELFGRTYTDVLRRIVTRPDDEVDFGFLAPPPQAAAAASSQNVVRLFNEQAEQAPDAPALATGDRTWTYRQLREAADRVARRLLDLGAEPGARVGIAMGRSPETIAVILGVAKARAACVPLDLSYPKARLAAMVELARPFRVVSDDPNLVGPDLRIPVESLFTGPVGAALPEVELDDTAYVLFTSGSTGEPKGVVMPHRSLGNLVAWQNRAPSAAGITAQYAPLSFDVSFQEVFSTLCSGGTLRLITEAERRDMGALLRLLDGDGVERIFMPYVALQQLAEAAIALGTFPHRLRVIVSSGEQLRVTDEIRTLVGALPGAILENQYGPTETHVVTSHTLAGDPACFPALVPIGVPVDGAEVHVLDSRGRPAPVGVRGELFLGGVAVANGYLGDPELTRKRFVSHDGARVYRTGDLGVVLPDGTIAYLGRADSQVKIRGYRVEPAEAELALLRAGVREAAVVARDQGDGTMELVAFLVDEADEDTLRARLRAELPEFLVPTRFEWLDGLPQTPTGKRDDAALRARPVRRRASADSTPPRDEYERTLTDLLGIEGVGVHDDIFAAGATSITAMRLVVLVEQRYGVAIGLAQFVAAPTVASLAKLVRTGGAEVRFDPVVALRREGDRPPLFLAHPMGGNVLCYLALARHLPDDQPLYALQAAGADADTEPLDTLPGLAASYVAAMRRVQPEGPYVVGGWSFGGFAAFEMARQLRAAGETVAKVVLLDTVALGPDTLRATYTDDALIGWFFHELLWLRRGGSAPIAAIPDGLSLDEKFRHVARFAVQQGVLPVEGIEGVVRRLFRMYAAHWQAAVDYRPPQVDFDLTLLRAREPLPDVLLSMHSTAGTQYTDPANGWRAMTTGHVEVVTVPGDHLTLMEDPNVAEVAHVVSDLIMPVHGRKG
jgi:amino acid adenylation domain-containing protein